MLGKGNLKQSLLGWADGPRTRYRAVYIDFFQLLLTNPNSIKIRYIPGFYRQFFVIDYFQLLLKNTTDGHL